jgi:pyridoxine kinase
MGIQVCPLPTAVLSTHGAIKGHTFLDLTKEMEAIVAHWKSLDLRFNSIYSGYLGSPAQANLVCEFIDAFKNEEQCVVVDPVLGDNGELYPSMEEEMVDKMRFLVEKADIITPNLTEACLLLGEKYREDFTNDELKNFAVRLSNEGPQIVIITSVSPDEEQNKAGVIAYNRAEERFWKVSCDYMPASYPGTGDAFASVITGALLQGDSLPIALDRAVQFISIAVRATFGYNYDAREGILLEKVLPSLNAPVQVSSYQLFD